MEKPMCKLCQHRHWGGGPHVPSPVTKAVTPSPLVTRKVTPVTETVTLPQVPANTVTVIVTPGGPCPTCGQKVPLTPAEKQRRYREGQRG